jgi:hypothetical protein
MRAFFIGLCLIIASIGQSKATIFELESGTSLSGSNQVFPVYGLTSDITNFTLLFEASATLLPPLDLKGQQSGYNLDAVVNDAHVPACALNFSGGSFCRYTLPRPVGTIDILSGPELMFVSMASFLT